MIITKCDLCKKTIQPKEGYTLKIIHNNSLISLENSHDICIDCYKTLYAQINKEENEDGYTES